LSILTERRSLIEKYYLRAIKVAQEHLAQGGVSDPYIAHMSVLKKVD
jgi:hypothetical protein